MGSRKTRKYWTILDGDVLNRVTVYKFGKVFSPKARKRDFEAGFDRPGLISKIHHLLQVHSAQRLINKTKNRNSCQILHIALFKAIRACFERNISESKLFPIKNLFLELLHCEGNLGAIFSILSSSHVTHPAVNILYNSDREENSRALDYYLQQISTLKVEEFGVNTGKPLDIINQELNMISHRLPLSMALVKRDPALVLTLLRHGAEPLKSIYNSTGDSTVEDDDEPNHIEQLVDDLNGFVIFQNTGFTESTRNILAAEEKKVRTCLTYFLRSVPSLVLSSSNHVDTNIVDSDNEETEKVDRVPTPVEPERKTYDIHPLVAATLNMSYFTETPKLTHLCRCAVRRQIKEANKLSIPLAIQCLPLPRVMKEYLDLMKE